MIKATLTAALALGLGGCFVPLSQGQAMENDLRILRDRLVAVEDRAETDDALLRERVAQAQRDAERIRETMAKVDKIARRADANFGEELVAMRQGMATIEGRLETMEHQARQSPAANPELEALRSAQSSLSERLAALEEQLKALAQAPPPKAKVVQAPAKPVKSDPQERAKPAGATAPTEKVDDSSRALFRGGRDALRDRRYGRAVELLERWVKLHGKKPSKRSALDDAYVYIGEALKGQKKPKRAIQSFQKVYKMGASKADMWTKAVFRMGECFEMLGDKAGARAFYKMASSKGSGGFAKKSAQRIKRLR